jgi:nitrous oxidase accessory protein NosD
VSWSASKIFRPALADVLGNVTAMDLDADAFKAALFDNTITPNQDVTSANSGYGAGVWASGGVLDASGWPAVGRPLASQSLDSSSAGIVFFDAADTVSANSNTTLTNAYGVFVYDDTLTTPVADQGLCFNYLGGANSVVAGTFTIVWSASGVLRFTL